MNTNNRTRTRCTLAAAVIALLGMTAVSTAQSDATLSSLVPSAGTLTPGFTSANESYTATVPYATASMTVTPTKTEAGGAITISVNAGTPAPIASGTASDAIPLSVGSANVITTVVTAADTFTTKTYTLTVTRSAAGINADLSGLVPSAGTLAPAFASGTTTYTSGVPYLTTDLTVTPTKANAGATITISVNGGSPVAINSGSPSDFIPLSVGSANVITLEVTAEDMITKKTYTLTVTRAADANLTDLVPSLGTLTPAFASGTFSYTATTPFANDSVTVTPTASDPGATIKVNGTPVISGNPSGPISLNIGANVITTVVVSADTTATQTYTLTVNRDGPITVANTAVYTNFSTAGTTPLTIFSSYPVTGVDKLVVTISGEHGFPNGLGIINSVTFAGQPMATAIKLENGQTAYREGVVGIFYLDNPSQYGATGDIVLDKNGSWNSYGASVMSLVGTAPGVDATSSAKVIIPTLSESVSIVTKTEYNIVVAATENGTGNTGVKPSAQAPMTQVLSFRKEPANYWTGGGSGYQFVKGLASATSTFTSASTTAATTIAASFGVAIPTLSWDIDGNTAGAGGATPDGAWNATTANWNANYLGTGDAATWTNGMAAAFAAGTDATGAYTVTVDGTQDIGSLAFEEGEVTLTGGTALRVSGFAIVNAASGLSATIETPLSEDAAGRRLTKTGSGTVVLAGNNTYTGDTAVSPAGGTLVLAGNNTAATGGMSLNGGVTRFESPASINGTARSIAVNAGGAVAFGPSFGAVNIPTALSGRIAAASAGAIAADNYDTLNFDFNTPGLTAASLGAAGNVTYTGTLTPSGTTYRLGGGGGTLTMTNANALTGPGKSLVINGDVTLPSANDFDAGTTLNTGVLAIGNNNCLGSGSLIVNGGGIASDSATAHTLANATTIAADVTLGNTVNNGKLTFTGPAGLGTVNRVITLNSEAELAGSISGAAGALTKTGTNTLTLSGANTYSGTTTVSQGTLVLAGSNSSTGTTLLSEGTTLQLGGSVNGGLASGTLTFGALNATVLQPIGADRKITSAVSLTYIASVGGTALISGSQNLEISGIFTFASGGGGNRTLTSSLDSGKALTLSGQVKLTDGTAARNQTIDGTGTTRITGQAVNGGTGVGSLTKGGTGLLVLSNTNTYTGATSVTGGTLAVSGTGAINSSNGITINGATAAFMHNSSVANTRAFTLTRGTLGGAGTISTALTAGANVIIAPGDRTLAAPAKGTLTVTNGVTLNAGSATALRLFGPTTNDSDKLVQSTTGTIAFGGVLSVSINGSLAPVAGTTYDLFDWIGTPTGTFSSFSLPALATGFKWHDYGSGVFFDYTTGQIRIDADNTPPTLAGSNIVDDQIGVPIAENTLVTYTVTFSEDMDAATVTAADFGNAGTSGISIGTITEITPGVFTVQVTPTSGTSLQLKINAGAQLMDHAGNLLNTTSAIVDDTILVVTDTTPPTLAGTNIVDNKSGGPVTAYTLVTYTVTFNERINSGTVSTDDFSNAGSSSITFGTITQASPGVFTVPITPTTVGTLILQVNAGAVITDVAGNALDTTVAIVDETTITVDAAAGYTSWAANNAPTGTAVDDYDGDGVRNGVEYVLGGTKESNDLGKLPKVATSGGNLIFSFERKQAAIDGTTTLVIETGTTLAAWPGSYPVPDGAVVANPGLTVTKDLPTVGTDTVTLTLPQAAGATKFARLKVTVMP